jgi:hypothetical protein
MAGNATITFSQPGVQPPVYVTTSLNDWTPVEMQPLQDQTASGDLVFSKEFKGVDEGSYQYKIRIGEDHWVLDESKETGMSFHILMDYPTDLPQLPSTKAFATMSYTSSPPARALRRAQLPKPPPHRRCRPPQGTPQRYQRTAKTAQWTRTSCPVPPQTMAGALPTQNQTLRRPK